MTIYYRTQLGTVERFLFTSERYLLSGYFSRHISKCVKNCVPSLRTCVPLDFTSEWVDPIKYRIDFHADAFRVVVYQGCAQ